MSISTQERTVPGVAFAGRHKAPGWLVGPWFDLLFIANVAWPLVLLAQVGEGFAGMRACSSGSSTTSPRRTAGSRWSSCFSTASGLISAKCVFLALAAVVITACLAVRISTGALTCLLAIDYVWNAWHFASQHHGIYRIYGRLGESMPPTGLALEKWTMRCFLLYVILRVASATWSDTSWDNVLRTCDWAAVLVPAWLIARNVLQSGFSSPGRTAYLLSVSCLYLSLLWAVHTRRPGLVLSLATASALFHAIEYLALVSWSVRARHTASADKMGLLGYFVPRWGIALAVFMLVLGAAGWFMDARFLEAWLLINVVVAFLHYAYDGLIWRRGSVRSNA